MLMTHIITSENLPARSVVQNQPLHSQNLQDQHPLIILEIPLLDPINPILFDKPFQNRIKAIQQRDVGM